MSTHIDLYQHQVMDGRAEVWIDGPAHAAYRVSPWLLGKFCEHLGFNIYHGMEAQLLLNPTFGRWSFTAAGDSASRPDGGVAAEADRARIAQQAQRYGEQLGLHEAGLLLRELEDGCAFGWVRLGDVEAVRTSPDCGPHGDRAQRIEVLETAPSGPLGIAQRTYLPRQRTAGYEFRLVARAMEPTRITLSLSAVGADGRAGTPLAEAEVNLEDEWTTLRGRLDLPTAGDTPSDGVYEFALTAPGGANLVVDRLLLYPDDHVDHADPEVICLLRQSRLPLLRWPGGNFVSGYHWRDGIGPVDARPTLPNPAWTGLEPNLFGTDEFIAFCRAVGCEPMICVNAGLGTPQEAAEWVEYCNGGPETPMGRLRAQNGHPEPYGVHIWEVGNEVHGDWQVGWTTPGGYVDRYRRFARAMRAADPTMHLLACGEQLLGQRSVWNRRLIDECGPEVLTDHLLTGGRVGPDTDPAELYQAFMGYAGTLAGLYEPLLERMAGRGTAELRIAITELQLFAHFSGQPRPGKPLRPEWLPTPATIAEAVYLLTLVHALIRMQGAVEMLTHSATVNHGGGLRKAQERVWANPVHYAHQLLAPLVGGAPLAVRVACPTYDTAHSFGHIPALQGVPAVDALAVQSADGRQCIVTLADRRAAGPPLELTLHLGPLATGGEAEVVTLAGDKMYDQNTLAEPERISPQESRLTVREGAVRLTLRPYTLLRLTLNWAGAPLPEEMGPHVAAGD